MVTFQESYINNTHKACVTILYRGLPLQVIINDYGPRIFRLVFLV